MRPAPRPVGPPIRMLGVAAGVVLISGAALVGVPDAAAPSGLTAQTVAHALADAAPSNVNDLRVNGIYGSAHEGTWQFVAHMTWRSADGEVHGGATELPQNGGQAPVKSELTPDQLDGEQQMGWTIDQLDHALRDVNVAGALAMVDLEITAEHGATLIACAAPSTDVTAGCTAYDAGGRVIQRFNDHLLDAPELEAASVQRSSAPITATSLATGGSFG
jgi:hypothetical protein